MQNQYLDYVIDATFHGVYKRFCLSFEDNAQRRRHKIYFLPTVEIKDYNVMIDGKNFLDQPVENDLRTNDNIATGQGDDCATDCSLDYHYFKENYKMKLNG